MAASLSFCFGIVGFAIRSDVVTQPRPGRCDGNVGMLVHAPSQSRAYSPPLHDDEKEISHYAHYGQVTSSVAIHCNNVAASLLISAS